MLVRVLKKVDQWREYEDTLCDAFSSMCGLSKRLQSVQRGENLYDESGTKFAVGVLASYPGSSHALSQRLTLDINNNWSVLSQQLSSLHALVVYEIQKIESEALKLFPVIPVGAIAAQGSGTPLTVSECVLWICQIQKMITAEYLRKKDLFSQYTTNQVENLQEAALIWPASSSEGMVNEETLRSITERVSLLNK
mgnify:FL=1